RQLDDVVAGQPGQGPVVAQVKHLDVAIAGRQRRDELRRGLAVERAAALFEQLRLRRQRRIAVQLEQLTFDLGDGCRTRNSVALLGEHGVVELEVAQVVRGDGVELLEYRPRLSGPAGELVAVVGQESGKRLVPVDQHRTHPRQVVQADLVDEDAIGRDSYQ